MIRRSTRLFLGLLFVGSMSFTSALGAGQGTEVAPVEAASAPLIQAASCEQAAVQAAIDSANHGDTVLVPAGNCTWNATLVLPNDRKITLQGAGRDSTLIAGNLDFDKSGSRVTGFSFQGDPTIYSDGYGFRLDHSRIERSAWGDAVAVWSRNVTPPSIAWGLVDNNEIINGRVNASGTNWMLFEGDPQHQLWATDLDLGGPLAVYVEDNIFTNTEGPSVCNFLDGNYGGRYVARYNTMNGCVIEAHSSQEGGNRAIRRWEVYGNIINNTYSSIYYPFRLRGGTGVVFFNSVPGNWTNDGVALDNVRSYAPAGLGGGMCDGSSPWDGNSDPSGYPCRDQIGRDRDNPQWNHNPPGAYTQALTPAYIWLNKTESNAELSVDVINDSQNHIKPDRDYYAFNPAFDGTAGMGCGLLAVRPATCTIGVGYWATDQSCSDLSGLVGASHSGAIEGALYKCSASNTWTLHYQPYTYPHPLRGEGGLAVTTSSLPSGMLGQAYSQALQAVGGNPPYTWTLAEGSLPAGLELSPAGLITGVPTIAETRSFTIQVADQAQRTDQQALSLAVIDPSQFVFLPLALSHSGIQAGMAPFSSPAGISPATSCQQADVQAAIDLAQDGDTVLVPAGSCAWTTTEPRTPAVKIADKAIILQGAGIGQTIITDSTGADAFEQALVVNVLQGKFVRVTGFTFQGGHSDEWHGLVNIWGVADCCTRFRLDHVRFADTINHTVEVGNVYGVIDHCTFEGDMGGILVKSEFPGDASWQSDLALGSPDAVYIEDCSFDFQSPHRAVVDAQSGGRFVLRHNTIHNSYAGNHGTESGYPERGVFSYEIYANSFTSPQDWFTTFFLRGGTGVIFDNTANGYNSMIVAANYRSCDPYGAWGQCNGQSSYDGNLQPNGYPCYDQIGRSTDSGPGTPQAQEPLYEWNNTLNGADADVVVHWGCPEVSQHIQENRDFFNNTPRPGYTPYEYPHPLTRELQLNATPANRAIHLNWSVSTILPAETTWQISYEGPTGDQPSPISGLPEPTRAYTLTGLTNYEPYTITLNAMLDSTPILTGMLTGMPTDHTVCLPAVWK